MKTNELNREKISALADGELGGQDIDVAFAALRSDDARADWEIYHQIGDVLRSDDMALSLSPGFSARMSARLDAEPAIVAPTPQADVEENSGVPAKQALKRWAAPSIAAAAAMAAVAFVTTPQLMVALKGESSPAGHPAVVAATPVIEPSGVVTSAASDGVVLRDPRIDDYLLAHQRLSPSVYSTAQYARSATFASDSGK